MAKLTSSMRSALPKSAFAVKAKAPKSGSYPIPDASHARNALARSAGKPVAAQVAKAVKAKFPSIKQAKSMPLDKLGKALSK